MPFKSQDEASGTGVLLLNFTSKILARKVGSRRKGCESLLPFPILLPSLLLLLP
jgi:hypothetical protein